MAFNKVNEENVYNCVGHPSKNDMLNVINWLLNDDFTAIYNRNDIMLFFKNYISCKFILGFINFRSNSSKNFKGICATRYSHRGQSVYSAK